MSNVLQAQTGKEPSVYIYTVFVCAPAFEAQRHLIQGEMHARHPAFGPAVAYMRHQRLALRHWPFRLPVELHELPCLWVRFLVLLRIPVLNV